MRLDHYRYGVKPTDIVVDHVLLILTVVVCLGSWKRRYPNIPHRHTQHNDAHIRQRGTGRETSALHPRRNETELRKRPKKLLTKKK
jgi:hypothetical protein